MKDDQKELVEKYLALDPEGEYFLGNDVKWSAVMDQPVCHVTIGGVKGLEKLMGAREHVPLADPHYVFYEPKWVKTFKYCYQTGKNLALTGPSGTGKTQFMQQLCNRLNRPYFETVMHEEYRAAEFFGKNQVVNGNQMTWFEGPGVRAWNTEGALMLVDEINRAPAGVISRLHAYFEGKTKKLTVLEKDGGNEELVKSKGVQITMAANAMADPSDAATYTSVQRMDEAMISRIGASIETDYPPAEVEKKVVLTNLKEQFEDEWNDLVKNKIADTVDKMIKVANEVRTMIKAGKLQISFSLRDTLNWGASYACMNCISDSTHTTLLEIRDPATAEAIDNLVSQNFGATYRRLVEREEPTF